MDTLMYILKIPFITLEWILTLVDRLVEIVAEWSEPIGLEYYSSEDYVDVDSDIGTLFIEFLLFPFILIWLIVKLLYSILFIIFLPFRSGGFFMMGIVVVAIAVISFYPMIEKEYFLYSTKNGMSSSDYYWGKKIYNGKTIMVKNIGKYISVYKNIEKKSYSVRKRLMTYEYKTKIAKYDNFYANEAKVCIDWGDFDCLSKIGRNHQLARDEDYSLAKKYYTLVEKYGGELDYFQKAYIHINDPSPIDTDDIYINYSYTENCTSCLSTEIVHFNYDFDKKPNYCYMKADEIRGEKAIRSILIWVAMEERKEYHYNIPLFDLSVRATGNFAMMGAGETTQIKISPKNIKWTTTRSQIKNTAKGLLEAKNFCLSSWAKEKYSKLKAKDSKKVTEYLKIVKRAGLNSRASINSAYMALLLSDNREQTLSTIQNYSDGFSNRLTSQLKKLELEANQDYSRTNPIANAFSSTLSYVAQNGGFDNLSSGSSSIDNIYSCEIRCKKSESAIKEEIKASSSNDARAYLTNSGFSNVNKICKEAGYDGYSIWNLGISCRAK